MSDCYRKWKDLFNKTCLFEDRDKEEAKQTLKVYKELCKKDGAILFCVARGKFTEGHNFSDDLCRGLFIIGVPNLNINSLKTKLKHQYFNHGTKVTLPKDMFLNLEFKGWYYR